MDLPSYHLPSISVVNILRPISHNASLTLQDDPSYPWNVPIYGTVMPNPELFTLLETTCFLTAVWFTQYFPNFHSVPMGDLFAIAIGMLTSTQAYERVGMSEEEYTWFQFVQGVNPYNPYLPEPYRSKFWDVYEASTHNGTQDPWPSPYTSAGYWGNWRLPSAPYGILNRTSFYANASYGDKMGNFKCTNITRYNNPTNPISKAFVYDEPGQGLRTRSIGMQYSALGFFLPFLPRGTKPSVLVQVFAVLTALTTVVLGVRMWGRWVFLGGLKSFDYAIIVGWALTVVWGVTALVQNTYIGKYNWDLSMTDLFSLPGLYIAIGVLYPIALFTIKTSLLLFYRTLTEIKAYRICITTVFILCVFNLVLSVYTAVKTYNIQQFWAIIDDPASEFGYFKAPGAQLSDGIRQATVAAAGLNIAMDAVILALPLPLLGMLHKMSVRDTVLAGVTFMAGSLAIIAGELRMKSVKHYLYTPTTGDYTNVTRMNIWILIEMNLAIICASVPALRAIAMKVYPKLVALPFMQSLRFKIFGVDQAKRNTKPTGNRGGFMNTLSWALKTGGASLTSERRPSIFTHGLTPGALEKVEEDNEKDVEMGKEGDVVSTRARVIKTHNTTSLGDADVGLGEVEDISVKSERLGGKDH